MSRRQQNGLPHATLKSRRLEIEERLAAYGLARGPRRLIRHTAASETAYIQRLRAALESLGAVFSSFGLYLSSRIDLLPAPHCLELAAIEDRADAAPLSTVQTMFSLETGFSPEDAFSSFDGEPLESRLFYQAHAARLQDGAAVIVKITRPETEEQITLDVELLPLLRDALAIGGMADAAIKSVMADFRHALRQQIDFIHEARSFAALAQDAEEFDMLRAPAVYRDLSTARVLVIEQPDGASLVDVIAHFSQPKGAGRANRYGAVDRNELARLLVAAWLQQSLLGHAFPVEPRPENIVLLPDKRITFKGGVFGSLPPEPQKNLWDYLIAVSTEHPDRACTCLLREIRKEGTVAGEEELRRRFRQIVPFRDGIWKGVGETGDVSEHLFAQWQAASECGYLPHAHLPPFFRGLFTVAEVARRVAPGYAAVKEALRDVRLMTSLTELREMIGLQQLGDQVDRYALMMTELPQRLDQALTLASSGNAQLKVHLSEPDGQRRQKNRTAATSALLLLLAAVVLLSHNLAAGAGYWGGKLSAIVFVLVSALLLRVVSGSR